MQQQPSNQSGKLSDQERLGLEREINDKMLVAHSLAGAVREAFLLDEVFPLMDRANDAGYSVEFEQDRRTGIGRYFLEEVGEKWVRITHSTHQSRSSL